MHCCHEVTFTLTCKIDSSVLITKFFMVSGLKHIILEETTSLLLFLGIET